MADMFKNQPNIPILTSEKDRTFYSMDLSCERGKLPIAVFQPESREQLIEAVAYLYANDIGIIARGGGASYTLAYTPQHAQCAIIDTQKVDRIVEINEEDLYVIVEAGVTWKELDEALKPRGLRTPFWGPSSGKFATVGATVAQDAMFLGTGLYGTSAESVLAVEAIIHDGKAVRTGSFAHKAGSPFFRTYGPDLTGLFLADTGYFGVKSLVVLRLIRRPHAAFAGYIFDSLESMIKAQIALSKLGIGGQNVGFLSRELHFSVEHNCKAVLSMLLAEAKSVCSEGKEISSEVAQDIQKHSFDSIRPMLLGKEGELWLPLHAIFPYSKTIKALEETQRYFSMHPFEDVGVTIGLLTSAGRGCFLIEPSFYWKDALGPLRLSLIEPHEQKKYANVEENPNARNRAVSARAEMRDLYAQLGAVQQQIGHYYSYKSSINGETWTLIQQLKQEIDPKGLFNPFDLTE